MVRSSSPVRWAATVVAPWLLLGCGAVRAELESTLESASARGENMSNPAKPSSAELQQAPTPLEPRAVPAADSGRRETAVLAGGCFWGVEELLLFFFKLHDPTTLNRQGNDVGTSYRSAIFFTTPEQERVAREVKARVETSGAWKRPLVTEITAASEFYSAENYHQDYLQKHPGGYTCHFVRDLKF